MGYRAQFDRCCMDKRYKRTYMEICWQNLAPHVSPSRSLNVIVIRNWHYDYLLTFHSNHGPILYRFQDIARFAEHCDFFWTRSAVI